MLWLVVHHIKTDTLRRSHTMEHNSNPFTSVDEPAILGPGTLDMALPLVHAVAIQPGMRVLEVGGGTGQVATVLAKAFDVTVFTLEPWHGGEDIQARAAAAGVGDRVIGLTSQAQQLPFAADTFDAILSINSFEMIGPFERGGDERPAALAEMVRVARPGARVGIAEPMCLPAPIPAEIAALDERGGLRFQRCFRTVAWNEALFERCGLRVIEAYYFPEARRWWLAYEAQATQPGREVERELILRDDGRWLSLGLVVGQKL